MKKLLLRIILPTALLLTLVMIDLHLGLSKADIDLVFWDFRFPRVMAALLAGAALAGAGLVLQTLFRNPLAGPFIIGISPGASFAIGLLLLAFPAGFEYGWMQEIGLAGAGLIGGIGVLLIQMRISKRLGGVFTLLLVGVMFGYLLGAGVEIMQTFAGAEQIRSFVMWGQGNFDRVLLGQIPLFAGITLVSIAYIFYHRFQLDAYLPGESYAINAGVNVNRLKYGIILIAGLMAGITTALCGPIGFVGLVSPHIARIFAGSNSHGKVLAPTLLWGALLCVTADIIAHHAFSQITLNVNAVCAIIGAPVVVWALLKMRTLE